MFGDSGFFLKMFLMQFSRSYYHWACNRSLVTRGNRSRRLLLSSRAGKILFTIEHSNAGHYSKVF